MGTIGPAMPRWKFPEGTRVFQLRVAEPSDLQGIIATTQRGACHLIEMLNKQLLKELSQNVPNRSTGYFKLKSLEPGDGRWGCLTL